MSANSFAAIRPIMPTRTGESCRNVGANHIGEFIRPDSPNHADAYGRIMPANSFAAIRPIMPANSFAAIRPDSPYARGSANVTRAPRPSPSLCNTNEPLWASTIARAMVNPTPAPPVARVREGSTR
jgi:hypothetical protein